VVAIGGSTVVANTNIVRPGIVFATMFYNEEGELITYDLHEEPR